ncbi:hypothetical protein Tco_0779522 [Tanacetum coccineum]
MHAVKRIFRYLKGQPTLGLWYPKDSPIDLIAYSDSDYAGASLDRKSTTRGCQFLGCRLISWHCKKQIIVAKSTTEAEYIAASNCCGQLIEALFKEKLYGTMCISATDYTSWILRMECKSCQVMKMGLELKGYLINNGYANLVRMLFVDQHNMVAYLEKSDENAEFHQIVYFLSTCSINYALTISPTINASYIEQFWNTATSKTVNSVKQIHAIVDGKAVVISESSVRSDLLFDDEDGVTCLTNDEIFENLALMGYEQLSTKLTFQKGSFSPQWKFLIHTILHCISSKSTAWNEFSTNLASAVICLAKGQNFNFSKLIFDGMLRNLDSKKFLMYLRFLQLFLNNQLKDLPEPFNDTYVTPCHTKKVFSNMARKSVNFSGNITPLFVSLLMQNQAPEGEGLAIPPKPQPTPSTSQQIVSGPQIKSLQIETPPTTVPQTVVSHIVFHEAHIQPILPSPTTYQRQRKTHKRGDSVEKAITTDVSLDATQDSDNIIKTQSTAMLMLHSLGIETGRSQSQTRKPWEDTTAQTRGGMEQTFELTDNVPPTPHDSPLIRGYTPGSDEGRLKLDELITLCIKLSKQVLDLEKEKDAQAVEILNLKKRVKKLERKRKSSISHPRRRKYRQVKTSFDDGLDEEDASKQGRRSDKIKSMFKDKDFEELDDHIENVEEETVDMRSVKAKDKGKVIIKEGESVQKKSKKQLEQERLGFEEAIRLQEQINKEERQRIARDAEIAQQIQEEFVRARQEQEVVAKANQAHYIDWSDPVMLRYHALQNRSFSVAEVRKNMCMYLKIQGGYKQKHFKGMIYEDIRPIFKRVWDQNQSFVPMDSELEVQILKREDELSQEQLQQLMIIVPEEGMHVEALQTKFPIIDWKVHFEEPTDDKERALWVELKRLFKPDEDDVLWKLQRYMHDPLTWKLYDTCGVHHVSTKRGHDIFMLVEKDYLLTRALMTLMLCNKLRVDEYSVMTDELLRKIFILANRPR